MFLSAIFKLQPTRSQHRALETALEQTRLLYNAALEERISAYRRGVRIRRFDQTRSLTEIRGLDELGWSRYPVALGRWPCVSSTRPTRPRSSAARTVSRGASPAFAPRRAFEALAS